MPRIFLFTLASVAFWFVATVVRMAVRSGHGGFINPRLFLYATFYNPWYWAVALLPVGAVWFWYRSV